MQRAQIPPSHSVRRTCAAAGSSRARCILRRRNCRRITAPASRRADGISPDGGPGWRVPTLARRPRAVAPPPPGCALSHAALLHAHDQRRTGGRSLGRRLSSPAARSQAAAYFVPQRLANWAACCVFGHHLRRNRISRLFLARQRSRPWTVFPGPSSDAARMQCRLRQPKAAGRDGAHRNKLESVCWLQAAPVWAGSTPQPGAGWGCARWRPSLPCCCCSRRQFDNGGIYIGQVLYTHPLWPRQMTAPSRLRPSYKQDRLLASAAAHSIRVPHPSTPP